jgi:hypothetical protein
LHLYTWSRAQLVQKGTKKQQGQTKQSAKADNQAQHPLSRLQREAPPPACPQPGQDDGS